MKKTTNFFRLCSLLTALTLSGGAAYAQDLGAVKARMEQRQSAVDGLRDRQIAGENNRGFLEPRGAATGDDQRVISDENADRQTVYAALAAQTGADPDTVGRRRAQQLAAQARPGVWIQQPDGQWIQKR